MKSRRWRRRKRRRTYPVTPPIAPNPTERAETRALFHWPVFCLVWLVRGQFVKIAERGGREGRDTSNIIRLPRQNTRSIRSRRNRRQKHTKISHSDVFHEADEAETYSYFHTTLASFFFRGVEKSTEKGGKKENKNNIPTPTATQFPKINGDRTRHRSA